MESKKSNILDFLARKELIKIPLWHREFVWDEFQLNQLFEDIESIIRNPKIRTHFFGTIITKQLEPNSFKKIEIADGHQRLIAISLLLCGICDFYKAQPDKEILVLSPDSDGNEKKSKILYLNKNRFDYENIIFYTKATKNSNMIYFKTYHHLLDKIKKAKYKQDDYFDTLRKFEIIELKLSPSDNAQLIFDSVNSTCKKLTRLEKFKNYIYMNMPEEEQSDLWNDYWCPLEKIFAGNEDYFAQFMISYIIMQTDVYADNSNLDSAFSTFYNYKSKYKKPTEIVKEMFKFAQYFIRIQNADFSPPIASEIEKINALSKNNGIYSFIMQIIDDFQNGFITQVILIKILQNIYGYIETNTDDNKKINFAQLSNMVAKLLTKQYGDTSNE